MTRPDQWALLPEDGHTDLDDLIEGCQITAFEAQRRSGPGRWSRGRSGTRKTPLGQHLTGTIEVLGANPIDTILLIASQPVLQHEFRNPGDGQRSQPSGL